MRKIIISVFVHCMCSNNSLHFITGEKEIELVLKQNLKCFIHEQYIPRTVLEDMIRTCMKQCIKVSIFCFSVTGSRRTKRNNSNSQLQQITKLYVYLVEGLSFWGTRSLLESASAHLVRPKIQQRLRRLALISSPSIVESAFELA